MSRLSTAKRRAQRGLDTGRASATLLRSGECQVGFRLNTDTQSMNDFVRWGWLLHDR